MTDVELKNYLKDHLQIKWLEVNEGKLFGDDTLYIALVLDDTVISKIKFAQ